MDCGENQKAEIERIKRVVSQSFKSRMASRMSKKSSMPSSVASVKTIKSDNSNLGVRSGDLEEQNISSIEALSISNVPGGRNLVTLPLAEPWPTVPSTSEQFLLPHFNYSSNASVGHLGTRPPLAQDDLNKFSFLPDVLPAANEDEFTMIMHYLDKIFPLRFYFYRPSIPERGRDWLLNLLLRAKASYFTAVAFSVLHQLIFHYNGDIAMEQRLLLKLDKYHSMAIAQLQRQLDYLPTVSGPEHLKTGVEILACSMELMSIEVFRETKQFKGPRGDWEVHLQAAGALLSVIGSELRNNSGSSPDSEDSLLTEASERVDSERILPLNDIAGLDFFITGYIWSDISRCASIGVRPNHQEFFPYLTYLEEDRVRLDQMMGCRNWAMLTVKEISNLEAWKNDMQSQRSLSLPVLSRKSTPLEQRLSNGLKSVRNGFGTLSKYEQECSLVTEIWALSALTYLAVVVSGNSQLLPEVRHSVPKTLEALKTLPPHLLIRISWAFCVAGCMAHGEEMNDFRQLLYTADKNGHILGTLWNALEIMEEFWIIREDQDYKMNGTPWAAAMESLDLKILLI